MWHLWFSMSGHILHWYRFADRWQFCYLLILIISRKTNNLWKFMDRSVVIKARDCSVTETRCSSFGSVCIFLPILSRLKLDGAVSITNFLSRTLKLGNGFSGSVVRNPTVTVYCIQANWIACTFQSAFIYFLIFNWIYESRGLSHDLFTSYASNNLFIFKNVQQFTSKLTNASNTLWQGKRRILV
jgi:hypothetical protein